MPNFEHLLNKPFVSLSPSSLSFLSFSKDFIQIPEPCVQCTMGKNQKEDKCVFQGWGHPCVPCTTAHFSACEYSLTPVRRAEVCGNLGRRTSRLSPERKFIFRFYLLFPILTTSCFIEIISYLRDAVYDQQLIRAQHAILALVATTFYD